MDEQAFFYSLFFFTATNTTHLCGVLLDIFKFLGLSL